MFSLCILAKNVQNWHFEIFLKSRTYLYFIIIEFYFFVRIQSWSSTRPLLMIDSSLKGPLFCRCPNNFERKTLRALTVDMKNSMLIYHFNKNNNILYQFKFTNKKSHSSRNIISYNISHITRSWMTRPAVLKNNRVIWD